jgi:energy-coupling factor transporter ATP-binding protein EcfA2
LAFAVLEALDRPFMIYDEPTAGLDARGIAQFVAMARRLADSGRGIMVVSHDHGLIERLASRVISI